MKEEKKNQSTIKTTEEENLLLNERKEIELNDSRKQLNEAIDEDKEVEDQVNSPKKEKSKWKYLLYLSIILVITAVVVFYNLYKTVEVDGVTRRTYEFVPDLMSNMNIGFFFAFFGSVMLGVILSALIVFLFTHLYTKRYRFHQALANTMVGRFYDYITPGASGGQFAQVITFKKQGLAYSNGVSIFVMSFIIYQITLVLSGFIALLLRFDKIINVADISLAIGDFNLKIPMWIFILFGFVINTLVIGIMFFMSLSRKFQTFITNVAIGLLAKLRIVKNPEEKRKNLRIQVENFNIEFKRLSTNIPFALLIMFLNFLIIVNVNSQTFLSGLSMNAFDPSCNFFEKFIDSLCFTSFHQMATGLIPIPGSSGVSEIVFASLFGPTSEYFSNAFYSKGGISILLLYWRFITFYIPFVVYGIVAATYKSRGLPLSERMYPVGDRTTMLTIQLETYDERKSSSDTIYETKMLERKEIFDKIVKSKGSKNRKTPQKSAKNKKNAEKSEVIEEAEHLDD